MILLTDEEIMEVVLDKGLGVVADDDTRAIAKAQLKKALEEIDERYCDWVGGGTFSPSGVFIPLKDWQALLEETK